MYYSIEIGGTVTVETATEIDGILFDLNYYDSIGFDDSDGVESGVTITLSCDGGSILELDAVEKQLLKLPVAFRITRDPDEELGGAIALRIDPASQTVERFGYDGDGACVSHNVLKEAADAGLSCAELLARLDRADVEIPPLDF
jgi:hypothetical protein